MMIWEDGALRGEYMMHTPRCNDSSFGKKSKKGRRHNSRNTTGQLQAHRL